MERGEAAEVDSVDEVTFLPAQLLLIRVLIDVLRINIAQDLHAPTESVPRRLMQHRVAVLKMDNIEFPNSIRLRSNLQPMSRYSALPYRRVEAFGV